MLKRILFFASFIFIANGHLSAQVDIVPAPGISEQFFHEQNPPIFLTLNKSIPEKVLKAKDESFVAIRVGFQTIRPNQNISEDAWYGAGFAVWPNYVVTSLHLFGTYPAMWHGTDEFPTIPQVFDGQAFFTAQLVFYNSKADLALLKINTPNSSNQNFGKKSAQLIKMDINNKDSLDHLVSYDNFYAFRPHVNNPHYFFSLKLGPLLSITNNLDGGYFLEIPMGVLQGAVLPGFSGGPLFSPKGKVAGVVARSSATHTFVITTETLNNFLITAATHLGLDSKGKPAVPFPPDPLSPEER